MFKFPVAIFLKNLNLGFLSSAVWNFNKWLFKPFFYFRKPPDEFFSDDHDSNNTVPQPDDLLNYFDQMFANFDKVFGNFGSHFDNLPAIEPEPGEKYELYVKLISGNAVW